MCVRQNLCFYLCVRARMYVLTVTLQWSGLGAERDRDMFYRDAPGGGGPKNTHVTRHLLRTLPKAKSLLLVVATQESGEGGGGVPVEL